MTNQPPPASALELIAKGRLRAGPWLLAFLVVLACGACGALSSQAFAATGAPGEVVQFPLPSGDLYPSQITQGSDGNLWFTTVGHIGRITPLGQVTEFSLTAPGGGVASAITSGPEGSLWFTELAQSGGGDRIGRISTAGTLTEFPLPNAEAHPADIASGPDGNIWFTEEKGNAIGRITSDGQITEFPLPLAESSPKGITVGPDGAMWFTEGRVGRIGRITPAGLITEYPLPGPIGGAGIALGSDGNLWFTANSAIDRMTASGQLTEFSLGSDEFGHPPHAQYISAGPDGNLWFNELRAGVIGRITPAGKITELPLPRETFPFGTSAGPEGNVWFAAWTGRLNERQPPSSPSLIGRITPGVAAAEIGKSAHARRGRARIFLNCVGGRTLDSSCHGTLRLSALVRSGGKGRAKPIGLGRVNYQVRAETSKTVAVRLNARALALLSHRHPFRMKATATVKGGQGASRWILLRRDGSTGNN